MDYEYLDKNLKIVVYKIKYIIIIKCCVYKLMLQKILNFEY